jgi:hypothetical protein
MNPAKNADEVSDGYIWAMWLMFCRAPGTATGPGEPVDLGEIGSTKDKTWTKRTPYSVAEPLNIA